MKIRFGIAGTSAITERFLGAAAGNPDFELKAVYSRELERAESFGKKFGATLFFDDLEKMAESDEVDAVYIASPNALHASQSILCMKHGKHVLCEKPFASNQAEAEDMIEAARQNGVLLMEAMKTTLTPNFHTVKDHLYKIGKVRRYFGNYCRVSSRYDNYKKGIIENAFKPELSNGSLMDIGVYCIYPMVSLFGEPESLKAQGILLETGVDGQGTVVFKYDGMEAVIQHSKITTSYIPSEIQGDKGSLIIDSINNWRSARIRYLDGTFEKIELEDEEELMHHEIREMTDLIKSGKLESDQNTHENSRITMKLMDEARRQIGLSYPADEKLE